MRPTNEARAHSTSNNPSSERSSVVTANRLRTGAVVYLTRDHAWTDRLADALVAANAAELAALEAVVRAALERRDVTAAYAFDVRVTNGHPEPISVREKIRAAHAVAALEVSDVSL